MADRICAESAWAELIHFTFSILISKEMEW